MGIGRRSSKTWENLEKNSFFWQNRGMGLRAICLFICFLMSILSFVVHGDSELIGKDPEYRQMLKELNKRYEGFFVHDQEKKRWDSQRKLGIQEAKKIRDTYKEKRENARKNFVRVPPPNMEPARLRWEAEQKKIQENREKLRHEFSKKRSEIERVRASARKIPENKEVGLEE